MKEERRKRAKRKLKKETSRKERRIEELGSAKKERLFRKK